MSPMDYVKKHKTLLAALFSAATTFLLVRRKSKSLAKKNQELERLGRMKNEALAVCSHDMKSPLQSGILLLENLLDGSDGRLTEKQKESLETILKSEEELLGLITNLLDMARREEDAMSIRPAPVDLHGLLEAWARKQSVVARKKGLSFLYDVSPGLRGGVFNADAFKVQQALNNLASNAFKFTPEGGAIRFRADIDAEGRLFASIFNPGPAIQKEELSTIFDKYVQAEGTPCDGGGGTGIGLDIAKTIIELHGGRIWAESVEGEGNTFSFMLPPCVPIEDAKAGAMAGAIPCPA